MKNLAFIFSLFISSAVFAQCALTLTNRSSIDVCATVYLTNNCDTYVNTGTDGPYTVSSGGGMYIFNNGPSATEWVYKISIDASDCTGSCTGTTAVLGHDISVFTAGYTDCNSNSYTANWLTSFACIDSFVEVN